MESHVIMHVIWEEEKRKNSAKQGEARARGGGGRLQRGKATLKFDEEDWERKNRKKKKRGKEVGITSGKSLNRVRYGVRFSFPRAPRFLFLLVYIME